MNAKIEKSEAKKEFALKIWEADPLVPIPVVNRQVKIQFGSGMSPHTLYQLRAKIRVGKGLTPGTRWAGKVEVK